MQIDKNIPPPDEGAFRGHGKRKVRYPFRQMEIGDSVFFAGSFTHLNASRAYMAAKTIQKRSAILEYQGKRVIEDGVEGVRIWRLQ